MFPRTEISDQIINDQRFYTIPDGQKFKSVTTRISEYLEKTGGHDYLHAWREAIGDEEANKQMEFAAVRGSIIHNLCEQYVMNNKFWKRGTMPFHLESFLLLKKELDNHLTMVYGIEYPLYSTRLKTAGRTDLIGQWDKVPSIIDYKTSKKLKEEKNILGYFIQSACYAIMLNELIGTNIKQVVILITVDHEPNAQVFIKPVSDYKDLVEEVFG